MSTKSIIFIDSHVSDYQSFIDGLSEPAEVFILDGGSDGVTQMAAYLKGRTGIDAIHIISHGSQGALYLGSTVLDSGNLANYQMQLASIGSALTPAGDILLYGCNVAQGDMGLQFITALAQATGADVAASDDATGATALGGDWVLEEVVGTACSSPVSNGKLVDLLAANTAPTFNVGDGKVFIDYGSNSDQAFALAIQQDGKILLVGQAQINGAIHFALAQINIDGSLDTGFGGGGKLASISGKANSVAIQSDGKIVVGVSGANATVVRYNADGSLDTSFDSDGIATSSLGYGGGTDSLSSSTSSLAIAPNGSIFMAGSTYWSSGWHWARSGALTSFTASGAANAWTTVGGRVVGDGSLLSFHQIAIQTDGKIVAVGDVPGDFAVVRFASDGSSDPTFGLKTIDIGESDSATSIAIQTNGKLVVAGVSDGNFAVARLNSDGSPDFSFSNIGRITTDLGSTIDIANSLALQADGKIVVAGSSGSDFALVRYNTDGSLDSSFDGDGKIILDFAGGDDSARSVAIQSDGKILVTGYATIGSGYDFFAIRFNYDGSLDTSFDSVKPNTLDGSPNFVEGGVPVVLDSNVQVYDAELAAVNNGVGSYMGSTLTLNRHSGANNQDVFTGTGSLALANGVVSIAGSVVGTFTSSNGQLAIAFSAGTQTQVNSVMRQVAYSNSSDAPPSTVQIDWSFRDGNSGAQGVGGPFAVIGSTTVTLMNRNDATTGNVTISGVAMQGQTLTVAAALADLDGMATINYQWKEDGNAISGANSSFLILTEAQVAKSITVTASYIDGYGTAESIVSNTTAPVVNVNDPPTGEVAIGGTIKQGQTIVVANTLVDLDGVGAVSYQWKADGKNISAATANTLLFSESHVGKTITVTASYTDGHGTAESVTSAASAAVANLNDLPTGAVTLLGTATQGQTLTASNTIADVDGLGAMSYQWKANGAVIAGATGSTLVLTKAQVGKTITATASYTDGHGTAESKISTASSAIANINDTPTGSVTISGNASSGQVLTAANTLADVDGLGAVTYQWNADNVAISGAISNNLTLAEAQIGKAITVSASYTDGHGTKESVSSMPTAAVANIPPKPLRGTDASESLASTPDNDSIDGGAGIDTVTLNGSRSSHTLTKTASGWTVSSSSGGTDTVQNVERLKFSDTTTALDIDGNGGQAYRVYQAAFNRTPDAGGLGFWINTMDGGASLRNVAEGFVASAEFKALYGTNPTNTQIVNKLYENVLGRQGEIGGLTFWLGVLDSKAETVAGVLAAFSESAENQAGLVGVIGNGFAFTPFA